MPLTTPTKSHVLTTIRSIFAAVGGSSKSTQNFGAGKLYEAWTLTTVLQGLQSRERTAISANNGTLLRLRASHGPRNPKYMHFDCSTPTARFTIWTDVEVRTLSSELRGALPHQPVHGDKHELDIVACKPGTAGYPGPEELLWGIECKHSSFSKAFHRSMLGVRRELSLATGQPISTAFNRYPRAEVESHPSSVLTAYSADAAIRNYSAAGAQWDVDYEYLPML